MKHLFFDDYSEGAHPEILKALAEANGGQQAGYGLDEYSKLAAQRIANALKADADVHLIMGGTQANQIGLASILRHHEGIIVADMAHINTHEAGAIETTGHKIISAPSKDGKLTPDDIERLAEHMPDHQVKPAVVAITQPTEMGALYSKKELEAVIKVAKKHGLIVYVDGARMGVGVTAPKSEVRLEDLAPLGIDMLYLGGTKNGALCGEAMVVFNPELKKDFRYHIKQRGGLMAKGRLMGVQFARFFDEDNLWLQLGEQANNSAEKLTNGLQKLNIEFALPPATNQLFLILENNLIEKLQKDYGFYVWEKLDDTKSVVRLVCSWATPAEMIDEFLADFKKLV